MGGRRPVIGVWMAGDQPVGLGVREDDSLITKNLARFVPHVIQG
jgi:glutathionylspermidine synthase